MRDLLAILAVVSIPIILVAIVHLVVRFGIVEQRSSRSANAGAGPKSVTCASCGYDLRASRERCPECGTKIPTRQDRAIARGLKLDPDALQNDWPDDPAEPRTPAADEKSAVAHYSRQWGEAELLVQQLRARAVPAELKACEGLMLPHIGLCNWAVTVPCAEAAQAQTIIDRFRLIPSDPGNDALASLDQK